MPGGRADPAGAPRARSPAQGALAESRGLRRWQMGTPLSGAGVTGGGAAQRPGRVASSAAAVRRRRREVHGLAMLGRQTGPSIALATTTRSRCTRGSWTPARPGRLARLPVLLLKEPVLRQEPQADSSGRLPVEVHAAPAGPTAVVGETAVSHLDSPRFMLPAAQVEDPPGAGLSA